MEALFNKMFLRVVQMTPSTASGIAGAEIGKRAVENNFLDQIMENPQADWQSVAQGQQAKLETEQQIREYLKQEHPVIYQTAEGTYYFLSKTGKAIYITREIVIDVAPFIVAPEMAAGTGFYSLISRAALSGGANVVAQGISGQQFNSVELTGAIVSGTVSPVFKRTTDVIRFNAGVGMATGLANGGDGLSDAALSGIATYSSTKISNPVWSSIVSEAIQKLPNIKNSVTGNQESEDK
ncbi:VENN motif pre-toxin domain-containing protein [[Pasteurella] aerogenes]